jgi:hypothetical protein
MPRTGAVIDIIAASRIIIVIVPAAIAARRIAIRSIIAVAIIAATAIIAGADAHAAITIAVIIGAAPQGHRARETKRSQES